MGITATTGTTPRASPMPGPGPDYAYGGVCSEGWWQTLRYGHVRPQWGIRCLRGGRRHYLD